MTARPGVTAGATGRGHHPGPVASVGPGRPGAAADGTALHGPAAGFPSPRPRPWGPSRTTALLSGPARGLPPHPEDAMSNARISTWREALTRHPWRWTLGGLALVGVAAFFALRGYGAGGEMPRVPVPDHAASAAAHPAMPV